jgi:hypothetical protein
VLSVRGRASGSAMKGVSGLYPQGQPGQCLPLPAQVRRRWRPLVFLGFLRLPLIFSQNRPWLSFFR